MRPGSKIVGIRPAEARTASSHAKPIKEARDESVYASHHLPYILSVVPLLPQQRGNGHGALHDIDFYDQEEEENKRCRTGRRSPR